MGAGQSSQGAQPRGENGTQTQGKALPALMLSRLEMKCFVSVQQIETKHSYLRKVKKLHFDPKKSKQNRETFLNMTVLIPGNKFFPIFFFARLFSSGKQKLKIAHSCTWSHLSQEGPILLIHACVHEHSHLCALNIHSASQWYSQPSLQSAFTSHIAVRPPAP